jgi:hypothetical protein
MIKKLAAAAITSCLGFGPMVVQAQNLTLHDTLVAAQVVSHHDRHTVRMIQRNLAHYAYYSGPIDGIWGPQTEMAVDLAHRAAYPHLYQVVDHEDGSGNVTLVPIQAAVTVVQSDRYVTLPHINRSVPAYYHIEGQGTVWLDIAYDTRPTAQRYDTLMVDRVDGYRVIAPTVRVPVVRH